jgi:cytochrome c-type biogenesis protein CcmH/NrfG
MFQTILVKPAVASVSRPFWCSRFFGSRPAAQTAQSKKADRVSENSGSLIETFGTALVLFSSLVMLSACGTTPVNQTVAVPDQPVQNSGSASPRPVDPDAVEVIAYRQSPPPVYTRPEPARAVQVLQRRAADQRASGQLVAAAGSLERALRIEPRNPVLWNQLAHVRVEQKQYHLASGLAAKSNAFAASEDLALRQDNQAIIAREKR